MGGWVFAGTPGGFWTFLIFTVLLGGAAAWATGRAFAATWRALAMLPVALIVLAAAVRFLHYALSGTDLFPGQEGLLSPGYFLVALAVAVGFAALGYRLRRVEQMTRQYPWLFAKSGTLSWAMRDGGRPGAGHAGHGPDLT